MADKIKTNEESLQTCGIVMPISPLDGCDEQHWIDVMEILTEAIKDANFEANLVSKAEEVGIIQKRIIQNLYENPIVVCDVSGKNPNVMFELGIRLAFDKPTIIIKDDKTNYSFDTAQIEHLEYPRDLRFGKIVDFKVELSEKIKKTYEKSVSDPNYTTFLKHFGEFKVAKIDQKEVPGQEYILEELDSIRALLYRLDRNVIRSRSDVSSQGSKIENDRERNINICLRKYQIVDEKVLLNILDEISAFNGVEEVYFSGTPSHRHLRVSLTDSLYRIKIRTKINEFLGNFQKDIPIVVKNKKTVKK